MYKIAILTVFSASLFTGSMAFAQELSGLWQQIDDKTGSPKALIEMKTQADGSYTERLLKSHLAQVIHHEKNVSNVHHLIPINRFWD